MSQTLVSTLTLLAAAMLLGMLFAPLVRKWWMLNLVIPPIAIIISVQSTKMLEVEAIYPICGTIVGFYAGMILAWKIES